MIANVIPTTATTLTASTNSLSVWPSQVPSSGFEGGHSQHSLWNLSCQETEWEWRSAPHFLQRHPRKQPVGESFSKCNSSERVKIYLKKQQCNEADADNSINMVTTALLHVWETNSVKRSVFFFLSFQVVPVMLYAFSNTPWWKTHIRTLHFLCESILSYLWQSNAETLCHYYNNKLSYCHRLVIYYCPRSTCLKSAKLFVRKAEFWYCEATAVSNLKCIHSVSISFKSPRPHQQDCSAKSVCLLFNNLYAKNYIFLKRLC